MDNPMLKVAAIHDLSGFGRCSLSVIMPVLSVMGLEPVAIPTAILSTHTGGFGDVEFRDLSDFLVPALNHYKRIELSFDAIYTGFLGSESAACHCLEYFNAYKNAYKIVDPVMGDNGKAYKTCTRLLRESMSKLVEAADVITPNLTEAFMLLSEDICFDPLTRTDAKSLLLKLSQKGPKSVVITGVELAFGGHANIGYDSKTGSFWYIPCEIVPVSYPGCGDIFAAVLTGTLLKGGSLPIAIARATEFTELCAKTTFSYGSDPRCGVMFEGVLPTLFDNSIPTNYKEL